MCDDSKGEMYSVYQRGVTVVLNLRLYDFQALRGIMRAESRFYTQKIELCTQLKKPNSLRSIYDET